MITEGLLKKCPYLRILSESWELYKTEQIGNTRLVIYLRSMDDNAVLLLHTLAFVGYQRCSALSLFLG